MNNTRQAPLAAFKATTHECRFPGCSTLTVHRLCAKHRVLPPVGSWAIAASLKAEIEREVEGER